LNFNLRPCNSAKHFGKHIEICRKAPVNKGTSFVYGSQSCMVGSGVVQVETWVESAWLQRLN
jgi:hypothetical protein